MNIDLPNHVVAQTIVDAITRHPVYMGPDDPPVSVNAIPGLTATERNHVYTLTAETLLVEC